MTSTSNAPRTVQIAVNGVPRQVPAGTSVAAALAQQLPGTTRTSTTGELRASFAQRRQVLIDVHPRSGPHASAQAASRLTPRRWTCCANAQDGKST